MGGPNELGKDSMSYNDHLLKLYTLGQQGVKFGLENILKLSALFDHPEKQFPAIHVAGSNGKGSVSTKIAKALQLSGKKVGLYTSPHISTFRERIQINGKMISEEDTSALLDLIFPKTVPVLATFFELTTLLAFLYFAKEKVDIAVIETGLGGRLDATNIIKPEISVITSISFDHTELLGSTLESITREKGGIVKPGVPVVIGPSVPVNIIQQFGEPIVQVQGDFATFDEENSAVAYAALETLKIPPQGLEVRPPCRMEEILGKAVPIILDVAHNPDGLKFLFQSLKHKWNFPFQVVCGLSASKDLLACAQILVQEAPFVHLVSAKHERAATTQAIARELSLFNYHKFAEYSSVAEGLEAAIAIGQPLLVCGSFFLMPEVRTALHLPYPSDYLALNEKVVAHYPHIR